MADVRAGDPFVCALCTAGAHDRCVGLACECVHALEVWLSSVRRQALRNGAEPLNDLETSFQEAYRAHQTTRRAADERRG